ncbi:hypothetical protein L0Y46_03905 [bacterium]|nr:hypothetical protein [bacterium]MCI0679920.1 hypothetical protein [bacterium]
MNTWTIKKIIKTAGITFLAAFLLFYSFYQAREYLRGPYIAITYPPNGSSSKNPLATIHGLAHNISYLTLNGSPIFTDEDGIFNERTILHPGYNRITLKARDRFDRQKTLILELTRDQ